MGLSRRLFTKEFKLAARCGGWKRAFRLERWRVGWK